MKTILQVNASILGDEGQSTRLANEFVAHARNERQKQVVACSDRLIDELRRADINNVRLAYAEGLATGEAVKTASLASARIAIEKLVPAYA